MSHTEENPKTVEGCDGFIGKAVDDSPRIWRQMEDPKQSGVVQSTKNRGGAAANINGMVRAATSRGCMGTVGSVGGYVLYNTRMYRVGAASPTGYVGERTVSSMRAAEGSYDFQLVLSVLNLLWPMALR